MTHKSLRSSRKPFALIKAAKKFLWAQKEWRASEVCFKGSVWGQSQRNGKLKSLCKETNTSNPAWWHHHSLMLHSYIFCQEIQELGMDLNLNHSGEGCQFSLSSIEDSIPVRFAYVTPMCPSSCPPPQALFSHLKVEQCEKKQSNLGDRKHESTFLWKHLCRTHHTNASSFSPSKVGKLRSTQNNLQDPEDC